MSRKSMQTKLLCVKFLEGIAEAVLHFTCLMTSKDLKMSLNKRHTFVNSRANDIWSFFSLEIKVNRVFSNAQTHAKP